MNKLITVQAAAELIRQGVALSLAGPESELDQLPAGNWIAGTSPYFMVSSGCMVSNQGHLFVTELSNIGNVRFASYGPNELAGISGNGPENGFALTIIPAGSQSLQKFAAEAADFEGAFVKPAVGWIAGIHLSQLGKQTPKVYDGRTATKYEDRAVVAYVELPADKIASIEIVNLFEPNEGDVLHFKDTSFNVTDCEVNGETVNFASYLHEHGLADGKLPLVGDFAGAHINVSLQQVGAPGSSVALYAPVFPGVNYHFAKPVADYAKAFRQRLADQDKHGLLLSCNCILNFVFGELEGKSIGAVEGPITFGEIGYQLLNQTMVMLKIS